MIINFNGIESFKLQAGNFVLAFNPISKKSKFKETRFGADVVCVSTNHPDFNGVDQTDSKTKKLFVVDGSGEYEIAGVFIKGFSSMSEYGGKEISNTIYTVVLDNLHIGFLGTLGSSNLEGELSGNLNNIDILFIPIGGEGVLSADEAYKLSVKIGAKIVIPMCYGSSDPKLPVGQWEKDALKKFLKASGNENLKAIEKLTIKKNDLVAKDGEVVVLKS
ncbi:MAG: MBL fold metallo-hydrolase [Candidatus Pacebacteria bacterium]|nr:MBL fold metallo-hydrolase [Candidatus Paceibacterota bacterium]